MSLAYLTVADRGHAESLSGMKEGSIVYNQELDAKMMYQRGKWVTFTDGDSMHGQLNGYEFCLTGKMWAMRASVETEIRKAGGRVARSMGKGAILVQGAVAGAKTGGIKSKKQLDAERNGHKVIDHHDLRYVLAGRKNMAEVLGRRSKVPPKRKERKPAEPIDRERHNETVKQVFDDIEAIVFGK